MTNFSISDYQDIIAQHLASQQHHSNSEAAYVPLNNMCVPLQGAHDHLSGEVLEESASGAAGDSECQRPYPKQYLPFARHRTPLTSVSSLSFILDFWPCSRNSR